MSRDLPNHGEPPNGSSKPEGNRGVLSDEERKSNKARASEIDRRLGEAKARYAPRESAAARGEAMGQGLKIAVELVVGVAFGGFVGWWLDRYFGTAPWLLILFFMLGFAAGMLNVIKTAQRMQRAAESKQRSAPSVRDTDDDR